MKRVSDKFQTDPISSQNMAVRHQSGEGSILPVGEGKHLPATKIQEVWSNK